MPNFGSGFVLDWVCGWDEWGEQDTPKWRFWPHDMQKYKWKEAMAARGAVHLCMCVFCRGKRARCETAAVIGVSNSREVLGGAVDNL